MADEIEFKVLNWEDSFNTTLYLFERIREDGFIPDVILGIARGGWIPGRLLADFFKLRSTSNIKVEFYHEIGETATEPKITQLPGNELMGKNVLIVDDVSDTGKSLKVVLEHLSQIDVKDYKIVTLYHKPHSMIKPDYYFKETTAWIVYPWEFFEFIGEIHEKSKSSGEDRKAIKGKLKQIGVPPGIVDLYFESYT